MSSSDRISLPNAVEQLSLSSDTAASSHHQSSLNANNSEHNLDPQSSLISSFSSSSSSSNSDFNDTNSLSTSSDSSDDNNNTVNGDNDTISRSSSTRSSDQLTSRPVPPVRLGRRSSSKNRASLAINCNQPAEKAGSALSSPTSVGSPPSSSMQYPGGLSSDIQEKVKAFHAARSRSYPDGGNSTTSSPASPMVGNRSSISIPIAPIPPKTPPISGQKGTNGTDSTLARSLAAARIPAQRSASMPKQNKMRRAPPGKIDLSNNSTTPSSSNADSKGSMASRRGLKIPPSLRQFASETPFSTFSDILDAKSGSLNFKNKAILNADGVNFSSGSSFRINMSEIIKLAELGKGNYGVVYKALHRPSGVTMAVKEIRLSLEEATFNQILMELDILHKATSPYIVDFYGAFFVEGSVFICMEYMDVGSMDKLYIGGITDEGVLARIAYAVLQGLKTLKEEHNIIHRDVKPTNVLVNSSGQIKLCDFGVSGNLVASISKTNIGCQSYMAPERIRVGGGGNGVLTYTVQADIWSLGLTILEMAIGCYPYPPDSYTSIFAQLSAICDGEPPKLPNSFSPEAHDFVNRCLRKNPSLRPGYQELSNHPWILKYQNMEVDMSAWAKTNLEHQVAGEAER
ncbi:STE/STE7 protein kinase Wis1 [Schizosaccharomyces cryophilus OY26]|uniref:mitogen-activated protein kinase kinase n=1 Tax=Schizosaccharomyces cryophilus (strain OY26 / ATCC MYA-4695 / CBS 11777 / NBRC 106824 / NRRL Y48691) TaxID=653667 RepID=S9WXH7_SCHCR|nr:STE/STE7 protein kinase Wis1 [Schizosaccharomyces cryophilus OY26]EPY49372.1 STE/STE7 protein kinase Wis1 [Schizosaccharomyces cryophilus OY26]